ncbi:L-aspartate oxidase [Arthrobacter sp. SO5]|uniref:L-aspartate oxidase n=1 Tax=Arthrobacter sp. SO5 TaxID=1897055 RepID=UPI001E4A690F|nr:FAD-binding protein [Arthrobacter sp. SO5]MCB5274800.1 L-aspartate oxidase [Arthrobacter sp. SO5]
MTRPLRLVVVGSGIAGLYAALLASDPAAVPAGGQAADVVLLSKGALEQSNTFYAQGGVSAVLPAGEAAPGDSVAAHIADTLAAGAGLNDPDAVRILCTEAGRDIAGLRRFGVDFDAGPGGGPVLGLEAAHSAARILHAGGDATGACIARALAAAVLERAVQGRLRLETGAFVTELLTGTADRRVTGVAYLANGQSRRLDADAVLLATGGAGRLFARTSNPSVATADGVALAWRAGAAMRDLEFFQFHPTTLAAEEIPGGPPSLLISEAVRGEGAVLLDAAGYRFMTGYHPDAELAPRDVVSRSIALHLAATGAPADTPVFLDARGIEAARGPGFLARRFPTITAATRAAGYDWTSEPLPVSPAAHYWMGGVATDLWGRTSVEGLFAAGEVACTGAQGANRLASNSLLEGLVFGRRAVEAFLADVPPHDRTAPRAVSAADGLPLTHASAVPSRDVVWGEGTPPAAAELGVKSATDPGGFSRDALRRLMTAYAGVLRSGEQLREAEATLAVWAAVVRPEIVTDAVDPSGHEDRNLLLAAQLLVAAARQRSGSVGAHYRSDTDTDTDAAAVLPAVLVAPARQASAAGKSGHRHAAASRPKQRISS